MSVESRRDVPVSDQLMEVVNRVQGLSLAGSVKESGDQGSPIVETTNLVVSTVIPTEDVALINQYIGEVRSQIDNLASDSVQICFAEYLQDTEGMGIGNIRCTEKIGTSEHFKRDTVTALRPEIFERAGIKIGTSEHSWKGNDYYAVTEVLFYPNSILARKAVGQLTRLVGTNRLAHTFGSKLFTYQVTADQLKNSGKLLRKRLNTRVD